MLKGGECMKKSICLMIFLNLIFLLIADEIENNSEFSFRDVKWNMLKQEIMEIENGELLQTDDSILGYMGENFSLNFCFVYHFQDEKVFAIKSLMLNTYDHGLNYRYQYANIVRYLIKIFGDPISDQEIWIDNEYKGKKGPDAFVAAMSAGHLLFQAVWIINGDTEISVTFLFENEKYEIFLDFYYLPVADAM